MYKAKLGSMVSPRRPRVALLALALACAFAAQADTPAALSFKKTEPADQKAFHEARATADPSARLQALQAFVVTYPDSHLVSRAQDDIFSSLIKNFPDRTAAIDKQARVLVGPAKDDLGGIFERAEVADDLANAGEHGIDLAQAQIWAEQANKLMSFERYQQWDASYHDKAHQPATALPELKRQFASYRAQILASQANVYLAQGNRAAAQATIKQAAALDPTIDEVNAIEGELALADHHDAQALDFFERAQLAGELKPALHDKLLALYRDAHGGSQDGLQDELDKKYAALFPDPIQPSKHGVAGASQTALVELFTGSGCPPCVAADLALNATAQTYSDRQVIVLAYEQHIPRPDPLANPDTVARGKWYAIAGTPTFFIDGVAADVNGGSRQAAPKTYQALTAAVDEALRQASSVRLALTAKTDAAGVVHASAQVSSTDATTNLAALRLNFALVQDHIRYSGENGIRYHDAVVRKLAAPADTGLAIDAAKNALTADFDTKAISHDLSAYLDGYEKRNDRYGPITFLAKDTTLDIDHLSVVAYVQDPVSKKILQAQLVKAVGP